MTATTSSYEWGTLARTTLHAIREIARARGGEEISTRDLLDALAGRPGPWAELWQNEPTGPLSQFAMAAARLQAILRPYKVNSQTITGRIRGYLWSDFEDAWQLHLPPINGEQSRVMELMHRAEEHSILEWVPVCNMFADRYQRPVNQREVDRIAQAFDFNKVGTIDLSMRDEIESEARRYACIDGWRRVCAARILGIIRLPARVYLYLEYGDEARLFVAKNSTKHPTAVDRFLAKVETGDDDMAVGIVRILGVYHLVVGRNPGNIRCAGSLERVWTRHGRDIMATIIGSLHEAWGPEPEAYTHLTIEGMGSFWDQPHYKERKGLVDPDRIVQVLKKTGPGLMYQKSAMLRGITTHPPSSWGHALHEVYNTGLRKNRLPPWIDRPRKQDRPQTRPRFDDPQETSPQAAGPRESE